LRDLEGFSVSVIKNAVLGAIVALGLALPGIAAERAIIVLDGSGSMWAQIEGKARITIARETLSSVLSSMPDDLELGLMTYGHRERGNCGDIEMLVQPASGTAGAISAAANKINPKGMTPLSDAVRLAAEELRFTEEKATVILITDGLETCEVDPCALGTDLEAQGIDFTTHVLGFGLSDDEGRQVARLAENTGGKYLSAQDGDALVEALSLNRLQRQPLPYSNTISCQRPRLRRAARIISIMAPILSGAFIRSAPAAKRAHGSRMNMARAPRSASSPATTSCASNSVTPRSSSRSLSLKVNCLNLISFSMQALSPSAPMLPKARTRILMLRST
jgi:hypothetical protein